MYKIITFTESFESQIQDFLSYLEDYFFRLYSDTGIPDQDKILLLYAQSIDILYAKIIDNIQKDMELGFLGRKILSGNRNSKIFYINSYRIEYIFSLDSNNHSVRIENISFRT